MNNQEQVTFDSTASRLVCRGAWNLAGLARIQKRLSQITHSRHDRNTIFVDGKAITQMDSAGAWALNQWLKHIASEGRTSQLENFSSQARQLVELIQRHDAVSQVMPVPPDVHWIARVGRSAVEQTAEFLDFLDFTGRLAWEFARVFLRPALWRWNALISVIQKAGIQALPIIGLLSFMIGIVIAYQMGNQLRNYGANIFIVNLLGLSILREFGPLITAIMVAGRTGSAFTAQLGMMKINQEVDALNTMGVTPAQLLLLPRLIGLLIVLPLLTVWADIFGTIGGMVMANSLLGVTSHDFLQRFQHEIPLRALLIGLYKTPVFALLIGSIGCFQGMQVRDTADSVGKNTTKSVVLAIFFIIIVDAIFSVIFSKLKL